MKRPLGVTIFGIVNLISGLFFILYLFFNFFPAVILGWVTDRQFYGSLDWFCLVIEGRLTLAIFYIFSFLLFGSGILMLKMKPQSRKIAIISTLVLNMSSLIGFLSTFIRSFVYPRVGISNSAGIVMVLFLFYSILEIIYLTDPGIKRQFNDKDVIISFKKPIIFIAISFIFPLILRLALFIIYRK